MYSSVRGKVIEEGTVRLQKQYLAPDFGWCQDQTGHEIRDQPRSTDGGDLHPKRKAEMRKRSRAVAGGIGSRGLRQMYTENMLVGESATMVRRSWVASPTRESHTHVRETQRQISVAGFGLVCLHQRSAVSHYLHFILKQPFSRRATERQDRSWMPWSTVAQIHSGGSDDSTSQHLQTAQPVPYQPYMN